MGKYSGGGSATLASAPFCNSCPDGKYSRPGKRYQEYVFLQDKGKCEVGTGSATGNLIETEDDCSRAAAALGLADTTASHDAFFRQTSGSCASKITSRAMCQHAA